MSRKCYSARICRLPEGDTYDEVDRIPVRLEHEDRDLVEHAGRDWCERHAAAEPGVRYVVIDRDGREAYSTVYDGPAVPFCDEPKGSTPETRAAAEAYWRPYFDVLRERLAAGDRDELAVRRAGEAHDKARGRWVPEARAA